MRVDYVFFSAALHCDPPSATVQTKLLVCSGGTDTSRCSTACSLQQVFKTMPDGSQVKLILEDCRGVSVNFFSKMKALLNCLKQELKSCIFLQLSGRSRQI